MLGWALRRLGQLLLRRWLGASAKHQGGGLLLLNPRSGADGSGSLIMRTSYTRTTAQSSQQTQHSMSVTSMWFLRLLAARVVQEQHACCAQDVQPVQKECNQQLGPNCTTAAAAQTVGVQA